MLGELRQKGTPTVVRRWAEELPSWIEVREVANPLSQSELAGLHQGEREAIQLARELQAHLLLIDERSGARFARQQGFTVTGTLGVLVEAAQLGFIPIEEALGRLAKTNFRRTPELFAQTRELVLKGGGRL